MGRNTPFRFKQFEVQHARSSMKVGVDAVVLGAWVDAAPCRHALEVGCGCGVISLMLAQRFADMEITAIDIHQDSVAEAAANFADSPWSNRLTAASANYLNMERGEVPYDLIISNPPYFDSGVKDIDTPRLTARHCGELNPASLLAHAAGLLAPQGRVVMVVPFDHYEQLCRAAVQIGFTLTRALLMRGREELAPKRAFVEFSRRDASGIPAPLIEVLTVETAPNDYTSQYRALCRDFYLKF